LPFAPHTHDPAECQRSAPVFSHDQREVVSERPDEDLPGHDASSIDLYPISPSRKVDRRIQDFRVTRLQDESERALGLHFQRECVLSQQHANGFSEDGGRTE